MPFLTTTPDLAVWEVSERYTSWLSACNIKLGVTGAASQTFFLSINKLADNIYTKFKKDPSVKIPQKA